MDNIEIVRKIHAQESCAGVDCRNCPLAPCTPKFEGAVRAGIFYNQQKAMEYIRDWLRTNGVEVETTLTKRKFQVYRCVSSDGVTPNPTNFYHIGDIVYLEYDDNTFAPKFRRVIDGSTCFINLVNLYELDKDGKPLRKWLPKNRLSSPTPITSGGWIDDRITRPSAEETSVERRKRLLMK